MSKAFTRESDDAPEQPLRARRISSLPPGAPNHLTPDGARRLREELQRLEQARRAELARLPDPDEAARRARLIEERIAHLRSCLQSAVVTPPPAAADGIVRFGASVTVREAGGETVCYRIVGVDEADVDRDWVSWVSPLARALLNSRVGQKVQLKLPGGARELEILGVTYDSA